MVAYAALLRAVNVGGTGKLRMAELLAICQQLGLDSPRSYLASGNLVFRSLQTETWLREQLEGNLRTRFGRQIAVLIRSADQLAAVLDANPFPDAPPDRLMVIFLGAPTSPITLEGLSGKAPDEQLALGFREIYVWYGSGMGRSRLRIPAALRGTARNLNTVRRLAALAASGS